MANSSCAEQAGTLIPVIDRNRCEGKEDCVRVCPYGVFEVRVLRPEERNGISGIGRLKAFAHRYRQAVLIKADECHACGLCVQACPEKAIKLRAVATRG